MFSRCRKSPAGEVSSRTTSLSYHSGPLPDHCTGRRCTSYRQPFQTVSSWETFLGTSCTPECGSLCPVGCKIVVALHRPAGVHNWRCCCSWKTMIIPFYQSLCVYYIVLVKLIFPHSTAWHFITFYFVINCFSKTALSSCVIFTTRQRHSQSAHVDVCNRQHPM